MGGIIRKGKDRCWLVSLGKISWRMEHESNLLGFGEIAEKGTQIQTGQQVEAGMIPTCVCWGGRYEKGMRERTRP